MKNGFNTFIFIALLISMASTSAAQYSFTTETCTSCGSENGGYLIYTPSTYDPLRNPGYSLLINLHGQNEAGDLENADNIGIPGAMTNRNRDIFDAHSEEFIVALPSTNNTDDWNIANVNTFLEFIKSNYNINNNRVFIAGVSMGAKGAWDYAMNYPDKITGVVSLMGSATPDIDLCVLNNVAIWSIQGENDGIFPPNDINNTGRWGTVLASNYIINNCSPSLAPHVNLLPGKTHSGWDEAAEGLSGFYVFDWMDQMTAVRNGSGIKTGITVEGTPLVNIGPDRIFLAGDQPYYFSSFILDTNKPNNPGITSRNWTITPSAGTISGNGTDQIEISGLSTGTYTVRLTVQDDQGKTNFDEITVDVVNSQPAGAPTITNVELWSDISGSWQYVQDLTDYQNLTFEALGENFDYRLEVSGQRSIRYEYGNNFGYRRNVAVQNFFGLNGHSDYVPGPGKFVVGFTAYGGGTFALTNPSITKQYIVEISATPLPVKFIGFTGKATLNGVDLKWLTTDEEGNSHFEIYRGRDHESFRKIGEVPKTTSPSLVNEYFFSDTEAEGGIYYYQVKSVDYDGHFDLTEIIRVDIEEAHNRYYVFPNPSASTALKIRVPENLVYEPMNIQIHGAGGQTIHEVNLPDPGQVRSLDISNLPAGLYHIRIFQNGKTEHFRFVRR